MTKEALKLALEALEKKEVSYGVGLETLNKAAITAIKEAWTQPSDSVEQEPVADYWVLDDENTFAEEVSFYSFREAKQAASDHGCGLVAYHRTLTRIDAAQPEQQEPLFKKLIDGVPGLAEELKALDAALPEQEPVATVIKCGVNRTWMSEALGQLPDGTYDLYTTPAQRPWVELTDEDVEIINGNTWDVREAVRMASAKSKEKNT